MHLLLAWPAAINLVTFALFAADRRRAIKSARRIRERTLLSLAALGGTLGALAGQRMLRHKTHKQPFARRLALIASVQAAAVIAWELARL